MIGNRPGRQALAVACDVYGLTRVRGASICDYGRSLQIGVFLTPDAAAPREILERVKVTDDPHFKLVDEFMLLEQIWIEQLQPFGERGYNADARIRQA